MITDWGSAEDPGGRWTPAVAALKPGGRGTITVAALKPGGGGTVVATVAGAGAETPSGG